MITIKRCLTIILTSILLLFCFRSMMYGYPEERMEVSNVGEILLKMAEGFKAKIDDKFKILAQFDIEGTDTSWHVIVEPGRNVTVGRGPYSNAQYFFQINADTLQLIADGRLTGMTAASKGSGSDYAPLDLKLADGMEFTTETRILLYTFIQHFFNLSNPEKVLLGEQYSRKVHGGHAISLYYRPGFRSAWYMIKRGERINEPGDTNPFPQTFIFIAGEGLAKIGDKTIKVKAGESYYIRPGSDHVVWTENDEPLVLIWIAWGEGA